jgi:hypothetical protein
LVEIVVLVGARPYALPERSAIELRDLNRTRAPDDRPLGYLADAISEDLEHGESRIRSTSSTSDEDRARGRAQLRSRILLRHPRAQRLTWASRSSSTGGRIKENKARAYNRLTSSSRLLPGSRSQRAGARSSSRRRGQLPKRRVAAAAACPPP